MSWADPRERRYSTRGRSAALALVVAVRARLAVGDLGLFFHGDEDELGDAPHGLEEERHRAEGLQLEGDLAFEAGVAPAGEGVVDPQAAESGLELEVARHVARDLHVLDGGGEHDLAGEELDVVGGELLGLARRADPVLRHSHVVGGGVDLVALVGSDAARLRPAADPAIVLDHGSRTAVTAGGPASPDPSGGWCRRSG